MSKSREVYDKDCINIIYFRHQPDIRLKIIGELHAEIFIKLYNLSIGSKEAYIFLQSDRNFYE